MQFSFDVFSKIRWQDFIDILILSFIIYRIFLMLRGTRTIQIMSGLLLVAFFFYLVNILDLFGSTWVLRNLFESIMIVFIVLFQSDIKKALAQMGTTASLFSNKLSKSASMVDKIFKVCEHFSRSGIGALIVLENEMGLGSYYADATKIDAEFSQPLLVSLFNRQSPLHDGAVIISSDNRIAYAGCILPLTKEIDFSKTLGTRHRAALGLSEESDAIILIVSEETGKISLAWDGELLVQSDRVSIKQKVREVFIKSKKVTKKA